MADLLPSSPDTSAADDGDPRVVGLDSDEADDVLAALSSGTARELLSALHDDPGTPSELADRVDTSLQNIQYHLEKLEDADVVRVIDTVYSEKGREMQVYAPTDQPLVVFAGDEEKETGLRAALSRLIGGIGAVAGASLIVQRLAPNAATSGGAADGGTGGRSAGDESTADGAETESGGGEDSTLDATDEETAGGGTDGSDDAGGSADGSDDADTAADDGSADDGDYTVADTEEDSADDGGSSDGSSADGRDGSGGTESGSPSAADDGGAGGDLPLFDGDVPFLDGVAGAGLPPGALFFAGGATVVVAWFVLWYARMYRA